MELFTIMDYFILQQKVRARLARMRTELVGNFRAKRVLRTELK